MMRNNLIDVFRKTVCLVLVTALFASIGAGACFAADDAGKKTDEKDNSKIEKVDKDTVFELDDEVKEWVDGGGAIPAEAKYATLSGSGHLWEIDSPDLSDGKVELIAGTESRFLAGLTLREWLKHQRFYGEKLGERDNRLKFKRPKGDKEI